MKTPEISVVIRTCEKERAELLIRAIKSVCNQGNDISIEIIIVHNGIDENYLQKITTNVGNYQKEVLADIKSTRNIEIVHCEKQSPGAALNCGLNAAANSKWLFFLDDDDCITPGLFEYLLSLTAEDTIFVQSMRFDNDFNAGAENYINRSIRTTSAEYGKNHTNNYILASSLFKNIVGKLYDKHFFDSLTTFDETLSSGEDLLFWSLNFPKLSGTIALPNLDVREGYLVNFTENSNSRSINLEERKTLLLRLYELSKNSVSVEHNLFIGTILNTQAKLFGRFLTDSYALSEFDMYSIMDSLYSGINQIDRERELLSIIKEQELIIERQKRQIARRAQR